MNDPTAISGTRRQVRELVDGTLEVKIHVDPRFKADFHKLFPEIDVPVALAPLKNNFENTENPAPAKAGGNQIARLLHTSGYFRNKALWASCEAEGIYTQAEHKQFVILQRCSLSGMPCSGDIVGHHARNSENSGTGIKPDDWYLLPVCHAHHDWAHRHATRAQREEHLELAVSLTAERIKVALKKWLGIGSLSEITAEHKQRMDELLDKHRFIAR